MYKVVATSHGSKKVVNVNSVKELHEQLTFLRGKGHRIKRISRIRRGIVSASV